MKIVILIAVAGLACSKADSSSPPPSPSPTESPVPSPSQDGVTIVSVGDPVGARVLRYRLAKGAKSHVELALELTGAGRQMPMLVQKLEIQVDDVMTDGRAKIKTTIVDARAVSSGGGDPSPMVASMTQSIIGLTFTATLQPNGKLVDSKVDTAKLPPAMQAQLGQLTQNLEQVAMQLPEAAVGVGAKWTTRKTVSQQGLEMVTVTTTEIKQLTGDTMQFASTTTVSAKDQTIKADGVEVAMKDIGGGGTGAGNVDLTRMTLAGAFELEFRGSMSAMGQTQAMQMKMKLTMKALD